MNVTPEYIALVQRERDQYIERDRLARLAAMVRACCDPSTFRRIALALRRKPAAC